MRLLIRHEGMRFKTQVKTLALNDQKTISYTNTRKKEKNMGRDGTV